MIFHSRKKCFYIILTLIQSFNKNRFINEYERKNLDVEELNSFKYHCILLCFRKALYCHKRAAHDPDKKKYKCDECGKAFLNPCHLERHKNTHVSDKPYKVR